MPCRHRRSSTGLGPGDRSGHGGRTDDQRPQFIIHDILERPQASVFRRVCRKSPASRKRDSSTRSSKETSTTHAS